MPRPRRWIVASAAALLLGGGAFLLLRPPAVTVHEVVSRDLTPAIQGVGTVEAKTVVQVSSKIGGRIDAVLVDQGDPVTSGMVLVRLDDGQLRADVRRAEAAARAADAQRADVVAGTRPEEIAEARANLQRAQAQLDDLLAGSRPAEVEELRERVNSVEAARVLAERELERVRHLHARELVARQELDRAQQAYDAATAQTRAARQTLRLALEGARAHQVAAARGQVVALEHRLALLVAGPRPNQVTAARAQAEEARAALGLARERLADASVRSPITGLVVSRELEPGATVAAGTPVLKVVDPRTAWVTVHVDERDTGALAVGDRAAVTLRTAPGRPLAARVARIRRESDRVTEQLAIDLALEAPPARLTLGEQAEARIETRPRRATAVVPLSALVRRPDGPGVLTVVDGRLRFRPVRPGLVDAAGWMEALDGVAAGTQVVVTPGALADRGAEGRRVRVTRSAPATGSP